MSSQEIRGFPMGILIHSRDARTGVNLEPCQGETLFHSPVEAQKAAK